MQQTSTSIAGVAVEVGMLPLPIDIVQRALTRSALMLLQPPPLRMSFLATTKGPGGAR